MLHQVGKDVSNMVASGVKRVGRMVKATLADAGMLEEVNWLVKAIGN